jgi:hypothetical protein
MLKMLKRWLGWEESSEFYASESETGRGRPPSATAHLFSKTPHAQPLGSGRRAIQPPKPGAKVKAKPKPKAPSPEFDPYNTGKFDRSASWERISKTQR